MVTGTTTARLEDRGSGRFALDGELSIDSVPDLWEASRQRFPSGEEALEIDLSAVEWIDSAGLALLVGWLRWAHAANRTLHYLAPPAKVRALAETNHLTVLLGLEAQPESA